MLTQLHIQWLPAVFPLAVSWSIKLTTHLQPVLKFEVKKTGATPSLHYMPSRIHPYKRHKTSVFQKISGVATGVWKYPVVTLVTASWIIVCLKRTCMHTNKDHKIIPNLCTA